MAHILLKSLVMKITETENEFKLFLPSQISGLLVILLYHWKLKHPHIGIQEAQTISIKVLHPCNVLNCLPLLFDSIMQWSCSADHWSSFIAEPLTLARRPCSLHLKQIIMLAIYFMMYQFYINIYNLVYYYKILRGRVNTQSDSVTEKRLWRMMN